MSDLWRRNCFDVCKGSVCVSDPCGRRYVGVCRGSVSVSDLWRRSCSSDVSVLQECQVRASYKSVK